MELSAVRYEVDDGVALVTLHRPDQLNALTRRMELEYRSCMATADDDPEVRVVVVTGSGRGFCAGFDLEEAEEVLASGELVDAPSAGEQAAVRPGVGVRPDFEHDHSFLLGLRKPVIAAINGPAAGSGFVMACFADIRFAAAGAKLTTTFARLGLPAEHGIAWLLPRIVGTAHTADLLFSSRVVLAEEAADIGLVNRVLPAEQLLPFTLSYARDMARGCSPLSLLMMKRQLYADMFRDLDAAATEAEHLMHAQVTAHDHLEGVAAFRAKRSPAFDPLR